MREIKLDKIPNVSVILPVHTVNGLMQTLDSMVKQVYSNFELVVVDYSGNSDVSKVLDLFSFDRRIIRLKTTCGSVGAALNFGHEHAKGEYLTWITPGQICYPPYVEVLYTCLLKSKEFSLGANFIYGDYEFLDGAGRPIHQVAHAEHDLKKKMAENYDVGVAFMYTRSLWENVGKYWEKTCENYNWCVRALQYSKFGLINMRLIGILPNTSLQVNDSDVNDCKELAKNLFQEELVDQNSLHDSSL